MDIQTKYQTQIEEIEKEIEQKKSEIERVRLQSRIEAKAKAGEVLTIDEIKLMPREDQQRLLAISMANKNKDIK
jgi:replication-associated recombination protein RarA